MIDLENVAEVDGLARNLTADGSERIRPLARRVKNRDDADASVTRAVHHDVRSAGDDQLSRIRDAAGVPKQGMVREMLGRGDDTLDHDKRRRTVALSDIRADRPQIALGACRPDERH